MDLECQLNGLSVWWFQSSKGKGGIRNCRWYRAVKLLGHGVKVVERVLEKRLSRIVTVDEM